MGRLQGRHSLLAVNKDKDWASSEQMQHVLKKMNNIIYSTEVILIVSFSKSQELSSTTITATLGQGEWSTSDCQSILILILLPSLSMSKEMTKSYVSDAD